jgi:nucleotide-binding universal stress UspA family protein
MKTLLVHVDASPRCAERLDYALRLARRHEARVTAMYAVMSSLVTLPTALGEGGAAVAAAVADADRQQRERARALFDSIAGGHDATWEEADGEGVLWSLHERALYHDLLVLGQADRSDEQTGAVPGDLAPTLMVDTGRPALVLPSVGHFPTLPSCVLVAWKPSREAARAATASLPMLRHAGEIHLAWQRSSAAELDPLLWLEAWLRRQGVQARVRHHNLGTPDVGNALLSLASDISADLLVMGCYGHGRLREFVLGGASRTVLRTQTLPLLMAH